MRFPRNWGSGGAVARRHEPAAGDDFQCREQPDLDHWGSGGYFALHGALQYLPYALAIAAASLLYVAVADLIPSLQRRVDPLGSLLQVLLIGVGVAIIAVAERLLG